MSYSMWPIHSIGFNILNGDYIQAVIKDIENNVEVADEKQRELFLALKEAYEGLEDKSPESFIEFLSYNWYDKYDSYDWYENFIELYPIGKNGKATEVDSNLLSEEFFGYEISYGSDCIFEPEFKSLEELLNLLKKEVYIPEGYDLFKNGNLVFLSGVQEG